VISLLFQNHYKTKSGGWNSTAASWQRNES